MISHTCLILPIPIPRLSSAVRDAGEGGATGGVSLTDEDTDEEAPAETIGTAATEATPRTATAVSALRRQRDLGEVDSELR
jgi:hypothetical protein